jgi:hypothetical protein
LGAARQWIGIRSSRTSLRPIATVIASGAAAFVAYRLGQNQIMVAKAQAGIAERNWHTENEKVV